MIKYRRCLATMTALTLSLILAGCTTIHYEYVAHPRRLHHHSL